MRTHESVAFFAIILLFSTTALAEVEANRPQGVAAEDWVEITDTFGFVVTSERPLPVTGQVLLLDLPVEGYFMIRGADGWVRVVMNDRVQQIP